MDIFDDQDSPDAPVYFVTDNELEHGPATDSDTFASETSSCLTTSTLASEEVAAYFQSLHGYQYTTDENLPILFPSDSNTVRVNILHNAIVKLFQGGQTVSIRAHEFLQRGGLDGGRARVLDLVTSSGIWAHEVADAYPTAEIVSIDVRPLTAFPPHPRITFEMYDVYAGIAEPDASFDFVHARQCMMLTKNFNLLLRDMHRVLKPGGMLIIEQLSLDLFEADDPSAVLRSSPRRAEATQLFRDAQISQGIDFEAVNQLSSRLDPGHPIWGNQAPDEPTKHKSTLRGFDNVTSDSYLIPNAQWHADKAQRDVGSLAQVLNELTWRALLPIMQIMGYSKMDAEAFVDRLLVEVKDPRYRCYSKHKVWCARKL